MTDAPLPSPCPILVVGSVAYDSVATPFGRADRVLGGSATYFAVAASQLGVPIRLVAVVGEDFEEAHVQLLRDREVDLVGLQRVPGKTFFWSGEYHFDLNEAHTRELQLNVFDTFRPVIPETYQDSPIVFLANIDPELQLQVLRQVQTPKLVACDTRDFWIEGKLNELREVLAHVDVLLINDGEARQLGGHATMIKAAREILRLGPKTLVVKRGEYGALLFNGQEEIFGLTAYPLEEVRDPTGAGDTFAGGFLGHLARTRDLSFRAMKEGLLHGQVMASFTVEDFSLHRLAELDPGERHARLDQLRVYTSL